MKIKKINTKRAPDKFTRAFWQALHVDISTMLFFINYRINNK